MELSKSRGIGKKSERAAQCTSVDRTNFAHRLHCPTQVRPATWRRRHWKLCSVKGAENERFMEEAIRWSYCHCFRAERGRERAKPFCLLSLTESRSSSWFISSTRSYIHPFATAASFQAPSQLGRSSINRLIGKKKEGRATENIFPCRNNFLPN